MSKKKTFPVVALRNLTVIPGMIMHFDISRKKSIKAVETAMADDQSIFLLTQRDSETIDPGEKDLFAVGVLCEIKQIVKMPGKLIRVQVEGICKGNLKKLFDKDGMLSADVSMCDAIDGSDAVTEKAIVYALKETIRQYAVANSKMNKEIVNRWLALEDCYGLIKALMIDLPMDYKKRQELLELDSLETLFQAIAKYMIDEINIYTIKEDLQEKVKGKVEKNQRDYVLREQLNVLNEELNGDLASEVDEFTEKIAALNASDEVKEKLNKEVRRLKNMSGSSADANVERGYIETCLTLPWNNYTKDNNDLVNAKSILEADHYGMEDIKKRILEALAVRNITEEGKAPIICLVGPPGTGKTSIAKSVAKALNKEYVRICLGGVRDEAEIRGHRKTYIGAMPGRIIDALIKAKCSNPLMLFDEIDKMSSDYKGDTSAALLEVLDAEQNSHFIDHYIEMPVDLSKVFFIATANDLSTISKPLLDRMEIIEVSAYTFNEKMHIAKQYLVKKQIKENGLNNSELKISDKALAMIIKSYTKEAGVRGLERQIGKICRVAVNKLFEVGFFNKDGKRNTDKKQQIKVTDKNLSEYLGKEKYHTDLKNKKAMVGIVRGLAWTSVGGDTLEIEVNAYSGKGELKLTGNLGDVMKESANIALSYVRMCCLDKKYNASEDYFEKHSFHLHVPAGATPKDGPSAGITMATAFMSVVTGKKIDANLAMTGEITLRGRVTAIGGLKEKLIAAKNAAITKVIVPKDNQPDVAEMDKEITDGLDIIFVEDMKQVFDNALV